MDRSLRGAVATKIDGIEKLMGYREKSTRQMFPRAKLPVTWSFWRPAEKAELELMIAAAQLDPDERDKLLKIVPNVKFRQFNKCNHCEIQQGLEDVPSRTGSR
jgi:hypothetical protein